MHVDVGGLEPASTYWYGFRALDTDSPVARTRTLPAHDRPLPVRHGVVRQVQRRLLQRLPPDRRPRRPRLPAAPRRLHLRGVEHAAREPDAGRRHRSAVRPARRVRDARRLPHAVQPVPPRPRRAGRSTPATRSSPRSTTTSSPTAPGATAPRSTRPSTDRGRTGAARPSGHARSGCPCGVRIPTTPSACGARVALGTLADIFLIDTRTRRDEPVPEPAMTRSGPHRAGSRAARLAVRRDDGLDRHLAAARATRRSSAQHLERGAARTTSQTRAREGEARRPGDVHGPTSTSGTGTRPSGPRSSSSSSTASTTSSCSRGDVHVSLAIELHRDPFEPDDAPLAVEFVTPSITSQNLDDKMGWPRHSDQSRAAEQACLDGLPHWKWVDLDSHGYVIGRRDTRQAHRRVLARRHGARALSRRGTGRRVRRRPRHAAGGARRLNENLSRAPASGRRSRRPRRAGRSPRRPTPSSARISRLCCPSVGAPRRWCASANEKRIGQPG